MKNLILLLVIAGCTQTPTKKATLKNLVLIPGSHLDGSSWKEVEAKLNPEEFKIINLSRTGRDTQTAPTLRDIAVESCKLTPSEAILVAHSFGGAIANQMSGTCPEKIKKIIYVSGVVPLTDERPFDIMNKTDAGTYQKMVTFGRYKIIPKEAISFFKVGDPGITDIEKLPLLYPEWISLGNEMISYPKVTFEAIPKAYILTEKDPLVGLTTQFQYTSRAAIKNSDSMPTGHYPMLSNPERLATLIAKWAKKD